MKEIWQLATSPGILPVTILLGLVVLYWVIGALGVFSLDLDGGGAHAGVEGHGMHDGAAAHGGHHVGNGGHHSGNGGHDAGNGHHPSDAEPHEGFLADVMGGMARLLNAREIPIMVSLTFVTLFLWGTLMVLSVLASAILPGWVLAICSLAAALVLTRVASAPLRPFFRALRTDTDKHLPVIGRTGVVRTHELTATSGQIEVPDHSGPMLLNARLKPGNEPLARGAEVIIFEHEPERGIYFVKSIH
ncbi:MAG: DUF1449 family protein [Akkermansiaceae bacterium]|nr:DUF1449 family protein [Akkermansiaceae bacterium]